MERVIQDIAAERARQDAKWGTGQRHTTIERMSILSEEVGEAATEANKAHWGDGELSVCDHRDRFRAELIHVAAVAVKTVEMLDAGSISTKEAS